MNPFVAFLILVPLLAAGVLTVGTVFSLVKHGPRWDVITAFVVLCAICGSLILLLKKTSRSPLLEFPGSDQVDVSIRKKLTGFFLLVIYLTLALMAIALLNIESVRNWVGLVCFILGLLMFYSAISQLRQDHPSQPSQSAESMTKHIGTLEMSLSSQTRMRNLLLVSLILMGSFAVILYRLLDLTRYFSLVDLVGFLFLGSTLWLWFTFNGISRRRKLQALKGLPR